eukprot:COSAG01_NODE_35705_length_527_cov_27.698598_1_plen_175_part_11
MAWPGWISRGYWVAVPRGLHPLRPNSRGMAWPGGGRAGRLLGCALRVHSLHSLHRGGPAQLFTISLCGRVPQSPAGCPLLPPSPPTGKVVHESRTAKLSQMASDMSRTIEAALGRTASIGRPRQTPAPPPRRRRRRRPSSARRGGRGDRFWAAAAPTRLRSLAGRQPRRRRRRLL